MVTSKNGHRSIPSEAGSMVGGVIAIVGGVIWIGVATSLGAPPFFPLFGLVFIGGAVFSMINGVSKASGYREEESAFIRERNEIIRRIDESRRS